MLVRISRGLALSFVAIVLACAPAAAEPGGAEITYWESVRDSKTPAELEAYLEAYPNGAFAPLARIRLKALKSGEAESDAPADAAAQDRGSQSPGTDSAKDRSAEASGAEILTLIAKLAKRESNGEQRTTLGVQINDLSDYQRACFRVPEATGALALQVLADTPASAAGIQNGDIIQEFEGKAVKTARALVDLVLAQPAGLNAKVRVLRPRALTEDAKGLSERAATGDANDMLCFAFVQMNGLGTKKNPSEANRWYRKAADAGSADAMYNLASNLANGTGIAQDIAEANRWYRKAADAGNANAMSGLAFNLQSGNGITKDAAEANRWYRKSCGSRQRHRNAQPGD